MEAYYALIITIIITFPIILFFELRGKFVRKFRYKDSKRVKKSLLWCEFKQLYPLKKLVLIFLSAFGYYLIIGIIIKVSEKIEHGFRIFLGDLLAYALVVIYTIIMTRVTFKYLKEPFKCVPIISKYISRRKLNELILADNFEPVEDYKESTFYNKFLIGKNWLYINGYFVSIKSIASVVLLEKRRGYRGYSSGTPYIDYYLLFTYLNGETEKIFILTKNWQVTSNIIECELNQNFRKILIDTLYNVININGLCITKFDIKDYYKRAEIIKEIARKYDIKTIKENDIVYENKYRLFMLSELKNAKIEGQDWLSIIEKK